MKIYYRYKKSLAHRLRQSTLLPRFIRIISGILEQVVLLFLERWKEELGVKLSEKKKKYLKLAEGTVIGINTREMSYKCLSRRYLTHTKVHKFQL